MATKIVPLVEYHSRALSKKKRKYSLVRNKTHFWHVNQLTRPRTLSLALKCINQAAASVASYSRGQETTALKCIAFLNNNYSLMKATFEYSICSCSATCVLQFLSSHVATWYSLIPRCAYSSIMAGQSIPCAS
jgi:hypothetical protein